MLYILIICNVDMKIIIRFYKSVAQEAHRLDCFFVVQPRKHYLLRNSEGMSTRINDLCHVLNSFVLLIINKETEVEKYIHDPLAFLSSCKLIKYIYPYHDKSDSFAINLIEHLKQYEPYLTNNDSKRIDDYNIYSRTNEGDTTSEEQIYNWFKPKEV